jgi:hypothetical protein
VSLLLAFALAWLGLAITMIVTVFVLTANKESPRYLSLEEVVEEPCAQNMNEAQRGAA